MQVTTLHKLDTYMYRRHTQHMLTTYSMNFFRSVYCKSWSMEAMCCSTNAVKSCKLVRSISSSSFLSWLKSRSSIRRDRMLRNASSFSTLELNFHEQCMWTHSSSVVRASALSRWNDCFRPSMVAIAMHLKKSLVPFFAMFENCFTSELKLGPWGNTTPAPKYSVYDWYEEETKLKQSFTSLLYVASAQKFWWTLTVFSGQILFKCFLIVSYKHPEFVVEFLFWTKGGVVLLLCIRY